jgi:hypothetical protein
MAKSERKIAAEFERLASDIVEAYHDDRLADVSNLVEAGLERDPERLAWALLRHAVDGPRFASRFAEPS